MALSYVKLFADASGAIDLLSDTEAGRLFKAVMHYINGIDDDLPGQEKLVFTMLKAQFERDAEAYERYSQKQRENGKKGGRPKKPTGFFENPENPTVFLETQKSQDKEEDKDKDKDINEDKEKEKDKEKKPSRAARFVPPSVDEVRAFVQEHGYDVDASRFVDYYSAVGWKIGGKSPMKDWKAAVRNWVARNRATARANAQPVYTDADYKNNW